jgi:hypothetical protein
VAHEFGLLGGFVEGYQILHRQAVEGFFAALGNVQQRRFGHGGFAVGCVQRLQHGLKQVVFEAHGGGRAAQQLGRRHAQQLAQHGVGQ